MHTEVRREPAASMFRVEYRVAQIIRKGGINVFTRLNGIKSLQAIIFDAHFCVKPHISQLNKCQILKTEDSNWVPETKPLYRMVVSSNLTCFWYFGLCLRD
jgi:hypothetical protein